MFNNIGKKIKNITNALTIIQIVIWVIVGIVLVCFKMVLIGLLVVGVGSGLAWLGSLQLYAFGELVDNSTKIANYLGGSSTDSNSSIETFVAKTTDSLPTSAHSVTDFENITVDEKPSVPDYYCHNCGGKMKPGARYCNLCGSKRDE